MTNGAFGHNCEMGRRNDQKQPSFFNVFLGKHAYFDYYRVWITEITFAGRHVAPLGFIIMISSQSAFKLELILINHNAAINN
jgi:hypothetical protein